MLSVLYCNPETSRETVMEAILEGAWGRYFNAQIYVALRLRRFGSNVPRNNTTERGNLIRNLMKVM